MQQEMMRETVYLFSRCRHNKVTTYRIYKIDDWHFNPLHVMSPNQAIPSENQEGDTFSVPNLPFSRAQRSEIFSETSSRTYRELCGPEGVVLQQITFCNRSPLFPSFSATAATTLWPLGLSRLLLAFLCVRANGRDSSQASVLSHAQVIAEAELITRKQSRACFDGWAI